MTRYQILHITVICFIVVFVGGVVMMAGWSEVPEWAEAAESQPAAASPAKAVPQGKPATIALESGEGSAVFGGGRSYQWDEILDKIVLMEATAERPRAVANLSPIAASASGGMPSGGEVKLAMPAASAVSAASSASEGGSSSPAPSGAAAPGGPAGSGTGSEENSSGDADGMASTPSNGSNTSTSGGTSFAYVTVTTASGLERYLRDDLSISGSSRAELFCAKNETESFQIIVTNKAYNSLPDVRVHFSGWQENIKSTKLKLSLYRAHYIKVDKPTGQSRIERLGKREQGKVGTYPDALIPFVDPYTGQPITSGYYRADRVSVPGRANQAYWVDVRVEPDVPAGTYTGSILVTSSNRPVAEIPVRLTVWDFTLPATRELTVWFSRIRNLDGIYGVRKYSQSYDVLMTRYTDMQYEHGVNPYFETMPDINSNTGAVTFTPSYVSAIRSFVEKYGPGMFLISSFYFENDYDKNGHNSKFARMLSDFHRFSSQHPDLGEFFVSIDEPYTQEEAVKIINISRILRQYAPRIKLRVNGAWFGPYYREAGISDWKNLEQEVEAAIDIRSIYSDYADTPDQIKRIKNRVNDGQPVVICTEPLLWCIDKNIVNYRVPAWRSYVLGATGIAAWQADLSNSTLDPWVNPLTHTFIDGRIVNGGGLHYYPGTPTKVGLSSPGGPVPTMRLKVFRDSVEDYAYFKLLEKLVGRSATVEMVSAVAPDFTTHKNPVEYLNGRKQIAYRILQLQDDANH